MSNLIFSEWLRKELEIRDWSQADLSRRSKVSASQITRIFSGERGIGHDSLLAIAHALKLSPLTVFRKAGLLPTPANGDDSLRFADWQFLLEQLTPEEEGELRQIAELKIDRRQKNNALKNLKHKKAG